MDPVESGAGDDGLVLQELKPSKGVDQDRPIPGSDPSKAEEGDVESNNASRSNGPQDIERPEYRRGWRRMIRNFTPSWFSVNMGTGITSILLLNFPYNARWLQYISYVIFALNVFSFILFFLLSSLRYTLWPKIWVAMIRHPAQSLFLGCFPMGLGTIVSMICYVCVPSWSGDWWKLAWALWWIQSILSVAICLGTPFIIMDIHAPTLKTMTAAWLLPVATPIVAAASGSVTGTIIPDAKYQLITLIFSYILWGMAVTTSFVVMVIYFLRLTTKRLVPKEVIVSTFIPIGPCGLGGFGAQNLGKLARELFKETGVLPASNVYPGDVFYVVGVLVALVLWSFGLVWIFLAIATICRSPKFPFNIGWWGFTFPLGVYALSTITLGEELPSAFFRILGSIFSIAVVLLWIIVASGTLWKAWTGELFFAPCRRRTDEEGKTAAIPVHEAM